MTDKDKELLIVDLCGRLPYGVIVDYKDDPHDWNNWVISDLYKPEYSRDGSLIKTDSDGWISYTKYNGCGCSTGSRALHLDKCKPYLRPMSSMTEEEKKYLEDICTMYNGGVNTDYETFGIEIIDTHPKYGDSFSQDFTALDWLNAHYFDYRGLIEKGLALEAPEGMY